jgi:tetratricopeptide (TPR) repeat protein
MAQDEGFCIVCGYYTKSTESSGDKKTKSEEDADNLPHLLADAYHVAALANVNMRNAAEVLEAIRLVLAEESNYFKAWNKIDDQIAQASESRLQRVLIGLRNRLEKQFISGEIARLSEVFKRDADEGWVEWQKIYVEALSYWRTNFCLSLCEADLPFPAHVSSFVKNVRRLTKLVQEERWIEGYGLFIHFAGQSFIPQVQQSKLLVTAGEIQQYHFNKLDKAKELFQSAEQLAPDKPIAICAIGKYCLQLNGMEEEAHKRAQRAITVDTLSPEGYLLMGEYHKKLNQLDAAEEWYQKGIRTTPGSSSGYYKLLSLYGVPEFFPTHEARLPSLLETIVAIDSVGVYGAYLEMGVNYQQNEKYQEAQKWFDKAIALDPARLNGYIWKGMPIWKKKTSVRLKPCSRKPSI